MLKVLDIKKITDMGFVREGPDYVCSEIIDGERKVLFRIYAGSSYIRHAKTAATSEYQLKKVYEWAVNDQVIWEDW